MTAIDAMENPSKSGGGGGGNPMLNAGMGLGMGGAMGNMFGNMMGIQCSNHPNGILPNSPLR